MTADRTETTVLTGGTVRTLDPERPLGAALVLTGGRIAAILDDPVDAPAGARRVDLAGACVVPGLVDAHVHFPSWALARRELRLFGCGSLDEALERVRHAARGVPPGDWLRGRGWRDELWSEKPARQALDAVAPGVRIALRAHDGHSLWVSSAALAAAGADHLAVRGGVVEIDDAGEPTGVLREESAWRFYDTHAAAGRSETLDAMRAALPAAAAAGVTGVHDKDGARGAPELFAALRDAGELTLRVWQSLPAERLLDGDIVPRLDDPLLRIGYVKAFMDGTLGSRTARLLDGSGVEITSSASLADLIRRAERAGFALAVHAIGDRANRDALDAFAAAATPGARHRIEHAQCIAPEDVARFAALGIAASVQYTHATSDRDLADRIWADRVEHAYPFRSLWAAGARLAGGSDAPVEELDPLAGLRAAVLRTDSERAPWRPEQAIPAAAALESFTVAPAWLSFDEDRRGRLRAGFDADLVVLDRDPLADPPASVADARLVATMVAGGWTHGPDAPATAKPR
jgi:predicted amidohydrolase YtcJ